nr:RNA-directed DNA polymerase, eukaryota, reverse transcriptase zinc-binding domain protein [Tanacetum cinerariifolium]
PIGYPRIATLDLEGGVIGQGVLSCSLQGMVGLWVVAWCGDIAFKNLLPRLYALESMKNIEVTSKLSHGGLEFSFRRNPRGGVEQVQFERLKEMVECVTLSNSNDRWSWSLVGSGDFSVSSVRKLIDNAILSKGISKTRWIKEIFGQEDPSMVNVYEEVVYRSFYWIRFRCKAKFSFIDWLKNPNLVLLSGMKKKQDSEGKNGAINQENNTTNTALSSCNKGPVNPDDINMVDIRNYFFRKGFFR